MEVLKLITKKDVFLGVGVIGGFFISHLVQHTRRYSDKSHAQKLTDVSRHYGYSTVILGILLLMSESNLGYTVTGFGGTILVTSEFGNLFLKPLNA